MSKRDILRAATRKGLQIEFLDYYWTPTPGESVPQWEVMLPEPVEQRFDVDSGAHFFERASEVIEWINGISPRQQEAPNGD